MKTRKFLAMLMATMPVVGFVACDDDDDDSQKQPQVETSADSIKVVKSVVSENLDSSNISDTAYCDYAYDAETGNMTLVINGLTRNCACGPRSAGVTYEDYESVIRVSVPRDTSIAANCFDVYRDTVVLGNLVKDSYYLVVSDFNKMRYYSVDIDLTKKQSFENRIYLENNIMIPSDPIDWE